MPEQIRNTIPLRPDPSGLHFAVSEETAAAAASASSAKGAGRAPSLSLSIGTQNPTNQNSPDTQGLYDIVETMTKTYDDKVKIYEFFNPFKKRKEGYDSPSATSSSTPISTDTDPELQAQKDAENRERSMRRTQAKLRDIIQCNDFDMFATFTFDPKRHDAHDWKKCQKLMSKWLENQKRLYGHFRYVMVSEPQKTGAIHFHALLGGFTGKISLNNQVRDKRKLGYVYKIESWRKNYGFADAEVIRNKDAISHYVAKYITKDFEIVEKGCKRYWASRNLKTPTVEYNQNPTATIAKFITPQNIEQINVYENSHCRITTIPVKPLQPHPLQGKKD